MFICYLFGMGAETLTDFMRNTRKVLKRVDKEDIVLSRRGKPPIRISLENRRTQAAAAQAAVLARTEETAGILSAALSTIPELPARLPELLAHRYAWIRLLPDDARTQFAREYVETLHACASIGSLVRLD